MIAGHHYAVSVTFRNSGSNTWTSANHYNLGAANDDGVWGLYRVALPSAVAPNQEVTFNFTITAPVTAANYNFQWPVVQDYVEWFGDYSTNIQVAVSGGSGNGGNAAECTWQNVPSAMIAGQSYTLSVKMLNTGSNTWTTANHYNLGTQQEIREQQPKNVQTNTRVSFIYTTVQHDIAIKNDALRWLKGSRRQQSRDKSRPFQLSLFWKVFLQIKSRGLFPGRGNRQATKPQVFIQLCS